MRFGGLSVCSFGLPPSSSPLESGRNRQGARGPPGAGAMVRAGRSGTYLAHAPRTGGYVDVDGGAGNRGRGEGRANASQPNSGFVKIKVLGAGLSSLVEAGCVQAILAVPTSSLSPFSF